MVRAANLAPDLNEQQQGDVQPESLTQLRVQSQATTSMAATDESRRRYAGVLAVANAFLNNVAGGAACYDVDMSMVAASATTEELRAALQQLRRLMADADSAGWRVADANETEGRALVVASAVRSRGPDERAQSQEFVLSIDITAACPIAEIVIKPLTDMGSARPFAFLSNQN